MWGVPLDPFDELSIVVTRISGAWRWIFRFHQVELMVSQSSRSASRRLLGRSPRRDLHTAEDTAAIVAVEAHELEPVLGSLASWLLL